MIADGLLNCAPNRIKYAFVKQFIGDGPHVAQGSPLRYASSIKVPVMLSKSLTSSASGARASATMANPTS